MLQLLSVGLLCLALEKRDLKTSSFPRRAHSGVSGPEGLYSAMVTGDKSSAPRSHVKTMKEFGLMHLLTPSGLHLGSALLIFAKFPRLRFLTTAILFALSFFVPGLLALKRMLVFYLANHWIRNTKKAFLFTFVFSLANGNFAASPLSFCFSLLFWGIIVFHQGSKRSLVWHLFGAQSLTAFFFSQSVNLAACLVNPLITAVFTLIFPALLFLYPLQPTRHAGIWMMELLANVLSALETLSFLSVSAEIALLIFFLSFAKTRRPALAWAMCFSLSLNPVPALKRAKTSLHLPLPAKSELLNTRKNSATFIDRKCRLYADGRSKCGRIGSDYEKASL